MLQFRTVSNHLGCVNVGVLRNADVVGFAIDSTGLEDGVDVTESWRPTDPVTAASASELSIDDRNRDERSNDSGKDLLEYTLSVGDDVLPDVRRSRCGSVASQGVSQGRAIWVIGVAAFAISCCERLRRGLEGSSRALAACSVSWLRASGALWRRLTGYKLICDLRYPICVKECTFLGTIHVQLLDGN
jgi:hypothetical protein